MPEWAPGLRPRFKSVGKPSDFDLTDGKRAADLDIGGFLRDDKGKPLSSLSAAWRVFEVPENASVERRAQAVYRISRLRLPAYIRLEWRPRHQQRTNWQRHAVD